MLKSRFAAKRFEAKRFESEAIRTKRRERNGDLNCRNGAPVCGENDAFRKRNGDLILGNEHRSAAKTMPGFGDGGTCTEIIVSLQTGARSPDAEMRMRMRMRMRR